ncbi:hypothetical protein BGLCM_0441 [Bifidobacterium gallicum DSM 20093 = LMG 11596]|uniref:Uncharacterized protein n=1 Tax=Bifidobacterium gallicum DSM 20093 = LMG 11596 TaxID=561180 RepID=A0A087AKN2_9BIFI|nr:hypothetical protein BGLCM_0441 [Bifidobacterium gallicum DSM 20093 = LMG 11596]
MGKQHTSLQNRISPYQRGQENHTSPLRNRISPYQPGQENCTSQHETASPLTNLVRKTTLFGPKLHPR